MEMIIQIVLLIVGFYVLIKGADVFVEGASSVAGNFKIPKILIGLTIVAFGTSAPEFAVSVKSLLAGSGDIVLGNVIGSNILNILLILGCSSLFHALVVKRDTVKKEIPMTLLLTTLLAILMTDTLFDPTAASNNFTRGDGIVVLLFFCIFIYYLFSMAKTKKDDSQDEYLPIGKAWLWTLGGIVMIVVGSNFVVDAATFIATVLGVSQKLISMTIIAIGTSLPELVTSITATRKGEYDLAIGNVVGSNIFNIGVVLGVPVALLGGITGITFSYIDLAVMIVAVVLLFLFASNDRRISRKEGILLLSLFVVYYGYLLYMK